MSVDEASLENSRHLLEEFVANTQLAKAPLISRSVSNRSGISLAALPLVFFNDQPADAAEPTTTLLLHFGKFDLRAGLKQNLRLHARWLIPKSLAERGGLKPLVSRKARITRENAAISFTTANFQTSWVKRGEVP